jgi:hypothetical protein
LQELKHSQLRLNFLARGDNNKMAIPAKAKFCGEFFVTIQGMPLNMKKSRQNHLGQNY